MKRFQVLIFLLALSATATAQYGNYNQNSVRNNSMVPAHQETPKEPTAAEIEKDRTTKVEKYMSTLKADLNLDELQFIAIKNELIASSKRMDIVLKSEYSDEEKGNEIRSAQEKLEKTILSYLDASQKDKYQLLKVQKSNKKDEKKDKKKKEKTTENKDQ